jgi:DNA-binding beta-propeller fold protein YncE
MSYSFGVSMPGMRVARAAFAALLFLICTSCGDTYRPVAFPIIPNPPNPGTAHFMVTLSADGMDTDPATTSQQPFSGDATQFNTSGDSISAETATGLGPVHATVLPSGNAWYVANSLDDTISASTISASSTHTTIALTDTSTVSAMPVFVTTTENGNIYVANYNYGTVSVISTASNVVVANVGVDPAASIPNQAAHPVALAELPNAAKVYSVNQGNGTVTSINTFDHTVGTVLTGVGASPVSAAARSDSQRVYVLDKSSGNISVIDPTTTPDTILGAVATAAGADFMLYDGKLNRLYVLSSSGNQLWAFDASPSMPVALLASPKNMVAPGTGSPCSASVAPVPTSLVALPDGSRIYVASYQKDTSSGKICSQASVFTSSSYVAGNVIPLGSADIVTDTFDYPTGCDAARPNPSGPPLGSRLSIASSADNNPTTRVYVSSCDQGNTSILTTVAMSSPGLFFQPDTMVTQLNAPLSTFLPPSPVNNACPNNQVPVNNVCPPPPQNPLFIVAGP